VDTRLIDTFGPTFLVDDVRDLELLTDLLAISQDHLNVVFAVASYLEQVPNGSRYFKPLLQARVRQSWDTLRDGRVHKTRREVVTEDPGMRGYTRRRV
jgi:hypothetical protein